ncbi:MAG TPA: cytochrome c3 family protein [Anaerolineales bacterium]|nr:cytochrome c3 family protein [Anaerolineales bacterium]
MKRLFFALVIGILLVAALTTTALADNGPHGGAAFANGSTDACASCHRAHTAQDATGDLLKVSSIYGLCTSCHNGTGAYTDVVDGIYDASAPAIYPWTLSPATGEGDPGAPLFGGGFSFTEMSHTWSGSAYYSNFTLTPGQVVTSGHNVDGATSGTVWGAGSYSATDTRSTAGIFTGSTVGTQTLTLDCTSCHDPHGYAGRDPTGKSVPSYRLLRYQPTGSNGFELSATALSTGGQTSALFTTANSGAAYQVAGSGGGATVLEPAGMGESSANGYKATSWWYTINSDWTQDPLVAALKLPHGWVAGQPWESVSNGLGDYGPNGRGLEYVRPAFVDTTVSVSKGYYCYDPTATNLVANPPFATTTGTYATYNGNCQTLVGTAGTPGTLITGGVGFGTPFDNSKARVALGLFCAQCHDRYFEASGSAAKATGDAVFMYQHASGAASATGDPSITCVDCHVAHGSSASMDSLSQSASLTSLAGGSNFSGVDSDLLKLDNRSMCATCHGTGINFQFTAPAAATATPLP